jgi:hypothetical protein
MPEPGFIDATTLNEARRDASVWIDCLTLNEN